jgi:phage terminase Nu1 subunit (DNA packaging protein)
MATVDVGKVANALNLTEQRVQQLVKEGLPREARGRYDRVECLLWYVRYLQKALKKKSVPTLDGGFIGEREERIRLLRAKADLREIELARERSQLVSISDVEMIMADLIITTRARLMALAPSLAPELVGQESPVIIHAKIEKAVREALSYLAKIENHDNLGFLVSSKRDR